MAPEGLLPARIRVQGRMWAEGIIHPPHPTTSYRTSPRGAKIWEIFRFFRGLPGPKLGESGPGTVTGLFPMFFCARRLNASPGDPRNINFPAGPGTKKLWTFSKIFGRLFGHSTPPKRPNLAPGPSQACSPCFFTPGDFRRAPGTPDRPRSPMSAPDTFARL